MYFYISFSLLQISRKLVSPFAAPSLLFPRKTCIILCFLPAQVLVRAWSRPSTMLFLCYVLLAFARGAAGEQEDLDEEFRFVTCGSAVKLQNRDSSYILHSPGIEWGTGSGQQAVTAVARFRFAFSLFLLPSLFYLLFSCIVCSVGEDNTLWQVMAGLGEPDCQRGQPIECGQVVRLFHVSGTFLHSHLHTAPLSNNRQEVSCFGPGDSGDNFRLVCKGEKYWQRGHTVEFQHIDTGKHLQFFPLLGQGILLSCFSEG